MSFMRNIDYDL